MSQTHAGYWLDNTLFDDDVEGQDKEAVSFARVLRLAGIRRATANFVNILTGRNDIPVTFSSGKESYTDGEVVVIAADDNPKNFDVTVGLALHEASHIVLTDFYFIKTLAVVEENLGGYLLLDHKWLPLQNQVNSVRDDRTVMERILHPALRPLLPAHGGTTERQEKYKQVARTFLRDIRIIMNILEDRRIDQYVYRNAGGYRPYYDALYSKYFITDEIRRNLKWNPEWREVTVENYINRLLLSFHPDASPDALPGLPKLLRLLDLPTIARVGATEKVVGTDADWKALTLSARGQVSKDAIPTWMIDVDYPSMPALWKEANVIYAYIRRFVAMKDKEEQQKTGQSTQTTNGVSNDAVVKNTDHYLSNLDPDNMEPSEPEPAETLKNGKEKQSKFNQSAGERQLAKIKDLLKGEVSKKKAKRSEIDTVKALDQAGAELVDIKGNGIPKGQAMVTRKMSEAMFHESWFIFRGHGDDSRMGTAMSKGRRMGELLAHRLQIRNDPVFTKNTRLQHGGLDRRLLAQLGMDITSVFQKSRVDTYKPALLHLTLDASGSMHGAKWYKVVSVATALAYASTKVRNLDVVVSIRGGNDNVPVVCIVFDSRVNNYAHFMKWMPRLRPGGATPEGLCFTATMGLILETTNTHDVYFINFSDGEPSFHLNTGHESCGYHGEVAMTHTRAMVQQMRDRGVKVLSYFIQEANTYPFSGRVNYAKDCFKRMYGEDAVFVNVSSATEVLRTLNRVLIARGT